MFNNSDYINKKIIFFIRHQNDLDFILPLILKTKKRKIVFWNKIKKNDPRIKYLLNINHNNVIFLNYFKIKIIIDIFLYFLKFLSNKLSNRVNKIFRNIEIHSFSKSLKQNKNLFTFSDFDLIAFDHIYNEFVESAILFSKKLIRTLFQLAYHMVLIHFK